MRQVMKVLAYFPNSERDAASVLALLAHVPCP
jgi:hypothetical protein